MAAGLPMRKLAELQSTREPTWPVRSTLLISWWLLREIEASRASPEHVTMDHSIQKVTWRLPSSKTDQAALGASRSHRCACSVGPRSLCPYHLMADHLDSLDENQPLLFTTSTGMAPSKQGWADTFQELARLLGIATHHQNGARAFTGHSAQTPRSFTGRIMASAVIWEVEQ